MVVPSSFRDVDSGAVQPANNFAVVQNSFSPDTFLVSSSSLHGPRLHLDIPVGIKIIMPEYGSIPSGSEDPDLSFEEYDVNYIRVKELSAKERWTKRIKTAVPIIVALIIIGGFGWFTSQAIKPPQTHGAIEVDYKDPAQIPEDGDSTTSYEPLSPLPSPTPRAKDEGRYSGTTSTQSNIKSKSSGGSGPTCSANSKCDKLGLVGQCCPTGEGVTLGCCD